MLSKTERNLMVEENMGLVYKAVTLFGTKYLNMNHPCISRDDLVQSASLALINAADKFNPEKGVEFSTYAMTAMRNELFMQYQKMMTPAQCLSFTSDVQEEYERITEQQKPTIFLGNDEMNITELKLAVDKIADGISEKRRRPLILKGLDVLLKRGEGYTIKEAGEALGLTFKEAKTAQQVATVFFKQRGMLLEK